MVGGRGGELTTVDTHVSSVCTLARGSLCSRQYAVEDYLPGVFVSRTILYCKIAPDALYSTLSWQLQLSEACRYMTILTVPALVSSGVTRTKQSYLREISRLLSSLH